MNQTAVIKLLSINLCLSFLSPLLPAQSPTPTKVQPDTVNTTLSYPNGARWTRAFGGSLQDDGRDVVALADGGFIIAGTSTSKDFDIITGNLASDGFLARFDKDGHTKWVKTYGSEKSDIILKLRQTNDGNLFACGLAEADSTGIYDAWILKMNMEGDTLWTKKIGSSDMDRALAILPTDDGGCIFTGYTSGNDKDVVGYIRPTNPLHHENMWMVKLAANGNIEWQKCITDGIEGFSANDIQLTQDNNLIVGGFKSITAESSQHALLIKTDMQGNIIWQQVYTHFTYEQRITSIVANEDNSFTITGTIGENNTWIKDTLNIGIHGLFDVWVMKVDASGNKLWEKFFGSPKLVTQYVSEGGNKIIRDAKGRYLIAGFVNNNGGNVTNFHPGFPSDGWIIQVDSTGKLLWQKTVGGDGRDVFNSIANLADGSIIAVGSTDSYNNGDILKLHTTSNDVMLTKIAESNFITGLVFIDKNENGIRDAGEPLVDRGTVVTQNGKDTVAAAVVNGNYFLTVDTGSYVSSYLVSDSINYFIRPASAASHFTTLVNVDTVNFALVKKADVKDLSITVLSTTPTRRGFTTNYTLAYRNKGTTDANVVVQLIIDGNTENFHSNVPASQQVADTVRWNITNLQPLASGTIDIDVRIKAAAPLGDTIKMIANILPVTDDVTPADNQSVLSQIIRGSFDPNDKIETHGSFVDFEAIQNQEWLTYIIRFQNTGTDTALNVYVRDTLDNNLNWNTLEMVSSSDDYELSVTDGNKLEWNFRDIRLPDSNINEPASHGYIAYRVKPKTGLNALDSIKNNAAIYFDFNEPVITNYARTAFSVNAALPSNLIEFNGKWVGEKIKLAWEVSQEKNVAHYAVERSADGSSFTEVAIVKGMNSNSRHSYEVSDASPLPLLNYYRLKTVDIDHHVAYSKTIVVRKQDTMSSDLFIYPNPTAGFVTIKTAPDNSGIGQLAIIDLNGKMIFNTTVAISNTQVQVPYNFSSIKPGTYFIQLFINGRVLATKLVKK